MKTTDARIISIKPIKQINDFLNQIPSQIKKYVTLNGRYHPIDMYSDIFIKDVIKELKSLYFSGNLTGILFVDPYYVYQLSKFDNEFIKYIELIPSINCGIDTIEKFFTYQQYIEFLGFKTGTKVILDRSLNRNYKKLKEISSEIRKFNPELKIETLVNEGCLYSCPFKINHDIFISLLNDRSLSGLLYLQHKSTNNNFNLNAINHENGCINYYLKNNYEIIKSPFIRPEDTIYFEDYIDVFKISGKIRNLLFLMTCFNSYSNKKFNGNLLELMDSQTPLTEFFFIFNDQFDKDFFNKVSSCDKNCKSCLYCETIFKNYTQIIKKK